MGKFGHAFKTHMYKELEIMIGKEFDCILRGNEPLCLVGYMFCIELSFYPIMKTELVSCGVWTIMSYL